jgi:hypothetical protein
MRWDAPCGQLANVYSIRAGSAPGLSNLVQADLLLPGQTVTYYSVPSGVYYVRVHAVSSLGIGPPSSEVTVIVR